MAKSASVTKAAKNTSLKKGAKKVSAAAVKKTTKTVAAKDKNLIKYADKSKGQSKELLQIFEDIKAMLLPYEKGAMKVHNETGGQVILINHKPVEIEGRKKPELWFAASLIQKGYIGFYFMPVYCDDKVKDFFKPELLKCLKGKSCFHIKKADKVIYAQIKASLKLGYDAYKKRGWI